MKAKEVIEHLSDIPPETEVIFGLMGHCHNYHMGRLYKMESGADGKAIVGYINEFPDVRISVSDEQP